MTRQLLVFIDGVRAGVLECDVRSSTFRYDRPYLARRTPTPLSLSLPVGPREYGPEAVEPFLWGLLPDNAETLRRWALDARPLDPTAVTESFLLKLLSLSGFHPSLRACAICGSTSADRWSSGQGGAVCAGCADLDSEPAPPGTLELLATLATSDLAEAGDHVAEDRVRRQSRAFLFGFCEYHLERRMRSFPIVARSLTP